MRHAVAASPDQRRQNARPWSLPVLAWFALALTILAWAPGVFAHASLLDSSPAVNEVLDEAPDKARLKFNEPVSPLQLRLITPDGAVHDVSDVKTRGDTIRLSLPERTNEGSHALSWRVISADGHPVGGTVVFTIGDAGGNPEPVADAHTTRDILIWLSRLGWLTALVIGVGLALWPTLASAAQRRPRRLQQRLLGLGIITTLLNLGLLGVDALDAPLTGLFTWKVWRTALGTSYALSALLALLTLAIIALNRPRRGRAWLTGLALVLLGATLAASGHASTTPPAGLARPAVWLHAVAATLWVGALLPLAASLKNNGTPRLLQRFSRLIPAVLVLLVASGGILIYLQFDAPAALWQTGYGRVLAAKLALVAVLLVLGAWNRYRLTDPFLRGDSGARHRLQRVIALEFVLAIAILGVVSLWRFTPPPRAAHAHASAQTVTAHVHKGDIQARLTLHPAHGQQGASLNIRLRDTAADKALSAQAVAVKFSNTGAGIEPLAFDATQDDDGHWQAENLKLPATAHWDVELGVLVSDFERERLRTTLNMPTTDPAH